MKVLFAPIFQGNTYQKKLEKALEENPTIQVLEGRNGQTPFFNDSRLADVDIVHFHWFDPYVLYKKPLKQVIKMVTFLLRLSALKRKVSLVWTAHNLKSHDSKYPWMEKRFLRYFVRLLDGISVHNYFTEKVLVDEYGVDPSKIRLIPHPNYVGVYPTAEEIRVNALREQLGIQPSEFVFMFLGQIRPYKGVVDAIKAFKFAALPNAKLVICGEVKGDDTYLKREIGQHRNIVFCPSFVKDDDIANYMEVADVMIYPYKDILTSGAMILGMSFKKACLASRTGSMSEFLDDRFLFSDDEEFASRMKELYQLKKEDLLDIGLINFSKVENDTWENMADLTTDLYFAVKKRREVN